MDLNALRGLSSSEIKNGRDNMICGKCDCEKKPALIVQNFKLNGGELHIQNIPAALCDCDVWLAPSIRMELQQYASENSHLQGINNISFEEI